MSSYLNIYLLPKKSEEIPNPKPLLLSSWSRASDLYGIIVDELNPAYIGNGDEPNYSDLTKEGLKRCIESVRNKQLDVSAKLQDRVNLLNQLKNLTKEAVEGFLEDEEDTAAYMRGLQEIHELLVNMLSLLDLEGSDFERVLINFD